MVAYNVKLALMRKQYDSASNNFTRQIDALSSESDPDTMMDKAATANESFSQTLARLASDLDSTVPPAEAANIHRQMAANMRQLSTIVGDVAQSARDHDSPGYIDNRDKLELFLQSAGDQVSQSIAAAGYDADQFARDGTLVRR